MTDPRARRARRRPTGEEMLARVRAERRQRPRAGCASTWAWRRASARPTGCSRRAIGGSSAARTSSSASSSRTAGRTRSSSLDGLEVVPRRRIEYRGVVVEEMDTDAVIARRPTVALVDELAHTNVPGSARAKRWEDVEVIRDAGIHVVSTLNVQHLESVADAVATITGAPVNERLPDDVLLGADEIELVDMSPHALRQRMKHGNVYPPERDAGRARQVLHRGEPDRAARARAAARRPAVEGQLEGTIAGQQLPLVTDRVLVLVDGSPASPRGPCGAAKLAGALHAALVAVVVETPGAERQPFDRQPRPPGGDRRCGRPRRRHRAHRGDGRRRPASRRSPGRGGRRTSSCPTARQRACGAFLERPLVDRLMERMPEVELHVVGRPRSGSHTRPRDRHPRLRPRCARRASPSEPGIADPCSFYDASAMPVPEHLANRDLDVASVLPASALPGPRPGRHRRRRRSSGPRSPTTSRTPANPTSSWLERGRLTNGTTWHAAGLVSQARGTHALTALTVGNAAVLCAHRRLQRASTPACGGTGRWASRARRRA